MCTLASFVALLFFRKGRGDFLSRDGSPRGQRERVSRPQGVIRPGRRQCAALAAPLLATHDLRTPPGPQLGWHAGLHAGHRRPSQAWPGLLTPSPVGKPRAEQTKATPRPTPTARLGPERKIICCTSHRGKVGWWGNLGKRRVTPARAGAGAAGCGCGGCGLRLHPEEDWGRGDGGLQCRRYAGLPGWWGLLSCEPSGST